MLVLSYRGIIIQSIAMVKRGLNESFGILPTCIRIGHIHGVICRRTGGELVGARSGESTDSQGRKREK